ncbi:MAG TPA: PqqD family protein [Thermoanaerobaculia bacterium]|nr:PqqD family protein [Thermoanaerobaculia bacterium]
MRVEIREKVRSTANEDGGVLLDLEQGKYFSLNGMGAEIWKKLQAGATLSDIQDHLQATYAAPPERIRQDLQRFVQRLQEMGVVVVSAS